MNQWEEMRKQTWAFFLPQKGLSKSNHQQHVFIRFINVPVTIHKHAQLIAHIKMINFRIKYLLFNIVII